MKKDERNNLQRLDKFNRFLVVSYWKYLLIAQSLRRLTIRHILAPALFAQVILFWFCIYYQNLYAFTAGNIIITAMAMLPITRKPRAHWVGK